MANNEFEVELRAGLDMVPFGESFGWNGPDDGAPILRHDLKVSEQGDTGGRGTPILTR